MSKATSPSGTPSLRGLGSLWAARDLAVAGNWMLLVAVVAWSYPVNENAGQVSQMLLGMVLPPLAIGLVARPLVSSRNARLAGGVALLVRAAVLATLAGSIYTLDLPRVMATVWLASVPLAFSRSAHESLVPAVAAAGSLRAVKAAFTNSKPIAAAVGAAVGTAAFTMAGLQSAAIAIAAVTAASAVLTLVTKPLPGRPHPDSQPPDVGGYLAGLEKGVGAVIGRAPLQPLAFTEIASAVLVGGLAAPQVAFTTWGLSISSDNMGPILMAQAIGLAAGTSLYPVVRRWWSAANSIAALSLGLMATSLIGFALSLNPTAAICFSMTLGIGEGMLAINLGHALSTREEVRKDPNIAIAFAFLGESGLAISAAWLGPFCEAVGPRFSLVLLAILLAVVGLYSFGSIEEGEANRDLDLTRSTR